MYGKKRMTATKRAYLAGKRAGFKKALYKKKKFYKKKW